MFRRNHKHKRQQPTRIEIGTSVRPSSPPLSASQDQAYTNELAARSQGTDVIGCAYQGMDKGIQCQFSGMPSYMENPDSYVGIWADNVVSAFPLPSVRSPGGYAQIMMGGGAGSAMCAADCACTSTNRDCACRGDNNLRCGYTAVNQTCVEPIPDGMYKSLAECESVHQRGNFYAS